MKPVVVCAAELDHLPEVRDLLEADCEVRYASAAPGALGKILPEADGYYASLEVVFTEELMNKAPRLRVIATPSTGLDHIDLAAADRREIAVLSLKDDRKLLDRITSTAELTWALILACARRFPEALEASREGHWARDLVRGHQIAYKTLGVLGYGRLGTIVGEYGQAFRMKIIACDKLAIDVPGVEQVSFERLLSESDVLTIHIHLTEENKRLFNRETLARMKPGSILVNTSRGAIIDEEALIEVLENGPLAAAGLDVIVGEWREDLDQHPLIQYARSHDNLIITPHVGGVTYEAQAMAYSAAAQKLVDYLTNA